jgi:hypothetical protein
VNILLDECVPSRLALLLTGHSVTTAQRRGWAGIKNGDLLRLAETFDIAVILIRSPSNRLEDIRRLGPELLEALGRATPRTLTAVSGT